MKSAEGFDIIPGNFVYYVEKGRVEKQKVRNFDEEGHVMFDGKLPLAGILANLCYVDERNAQSYLRDYGSASV